MGKKRYTSIKEAVENPDLQSVTIDREGKLAAFVKRTPDWDENVYRNHVWIYEKDNDRLYPITNGKNESSSPQWGPDKDYMAYLADGIEKGKKQIYLKSFDEFNGIQITHSKEGVGSFKWAPDGKGIFYTAAEADSEEIKKRKEAYGEFQYIDKEYKNSYLCFIELDEAFKGAVKTYNKQKEPEGKEEIRDNAISLTAPKDFSVRGFDLAPDGKKALLVCTKTSDIRDDASSLYILDIETKKYSGLNIAGCFSSYAAFSPDGRKIVYSKTPRDCEYYKWNVYDDMILETYDLEKSEMIMNTSEYDLDITPVRWTEKGILGCWQDKTRYRIGIISESGKIEHIYNEDMSVITEAAITQDGENIAYVKTAPGMADEFYLNDVKVTDESKIYRDRLLSRKEILSWSTKDGLEIEGVLSTPCDFDPDKKYPLLVVIHGGPTWASFPIHNMNRLYPIEQFVEKGFIVLEPNYRGSSGYGNKFRKANFRMLGIGDYEDVISGVDMLIEKGTADKDRVGVMGWSQGGYISAFCATYSNRFKAISVGAGISNWVTYYANTDITTFTREYLGKTPWEDPEIYAKTSPMTYIKTACTPTLIQHGDKDARVPVPNAFELYRGLQDSGVESELVIFKDMEHGPKKPGLNMAIMEQNLDWFTKHIK